MSEQDPPSSAFTSPVNPDWMHLQLNDYDFYMTRPSSLDTVHGNSLPMNGYALVPVIRIYGCLPSGHQAVCHVHGIFPYIYISYDGNAQDSSGVMFQRCAQLHSLLESKCQEYSKKKATTGWQPTENLRCIANVSVVKAVPFYGFHVGWSLFYKISFLNPGFANKLSDLIRDGKLFGKEVQTYETHLPYLLQFAVDFNLFGCSWMDFNQCYFRKPLLNPILSLDVLLMNQNLKKMLRKFYRPESNTLPENEFPRMGNGLLEIDIMPQYIRNMDTLRFHGGEGNPSETQVDAFDKPYVMSTKNIVRDISMQRKLMSLEPFQYPANLKRAEIDDQWQSSDEFKRAFENFEQKINTKAKFKASADKVSTLANVKKPHETVSELWPTPTISSVAQRVTNNIDIGLINTSVNHYSMVDVSDVEDEGKEEGEEQGEGEEEDEEEAEGKKERENEMSSFTSSDNYEKNIEGQQSVDEISMVSMDTMMTQQMARRKRKFARAQDDSRLKLKMHKVRRQASGIKHEPYAYKYKEPPVDFSIILDDLEEKGYPKHDYLDPFFGSPIDLKSKPYIYAGKRFEISSTHLSSRIPLPFEEDIIVEQKENICKIFHSWKYLKRPPTYDEVKTGTLDRNKEKRFISQFARSSFQKKTPLKYKQHATSHKSGIFLHNTLTHFSMEVHVETKGFKRPDPANDEVKMIVWCLERETFPFDLDISHEGILAVVDPKKEPALAGNIEKGSGDIPTAFYGTELDMFDALTDLVLFFDTDILSGFEVHNSSWGYIIERCRRHYRTEISEEFSRVNANMRKKDRDKWRFNHASGIVIAGRHIINIWRTMRSELNLMEYNIENLAFELLNERIPHFSFKTLTEMWKSHDNPTKVKTVISYWMHRVRINTQLLQKQDYISRIVEQARLTGIDFFSVYYRGSQYKVESILFRLCKQESFVLLSPSRNQVRKQKALECVPLVMEPESAFYKSPLVVLDFQSLYPSIMIAYNYCYSTMIGRVRELDLKNELGVTEFPFPMNALKVFEKHTRIAPNGIVYVKSSYRTSTLAKMLEDLLDTRMMVKKTMNDTGAKNVPLQKLLNRRQLALKLIANVTYGYASASFSGRMPCSDLADSIVQTGREILEKAITTIESNEEWGARVVYGDTDSLFVYLPGKDRKEAHVIGNEMAREVTKRNLSPISLKFEKVYHPSLLLSKKRYVGFMYESLSQTQPNFDAKGIETVRRDGHPAQQKIVKKCLQILFRTKDLSQVKKYMQNQFLKIHQSKVSLQDFCFAREVRLGSYKSEKTAPLGAIVATRQADNDHRARPQYKERVPFVVARGCMGQILRERCVSPEEFLSNENLELDTDYYIQKTLLPPLARIFNVLGVNVAEWAFEVVRSQNAPTHRDMQTIEKVLLCLSCINCGSETSAGSQLCDSCQSKSCQTATNLLIKKNSKEADFKSITAVCRTCSYRYTQDSGDTGDLVAAQCESLDCPVYFSRVKAAGYTSTIIYKRLCEALESINQW